MNGRCSARLIFIILILKFNNQVGQHCTHVETHCGPNVTLLLWIRFIRDFYKEGQEGEASIPSFGNGVEGLLCTMRERLPGK